MAPATAAGGRRMPSSLPLVRCDAYSLSLVLTLLASFIGYLLLDPFGLGPLAGLSFHAEDIELAPASASAAIVDPDNRLLNATLEYEDEFFGPESLAFDNAGGGPYVSLSDGRVVRRAQDDSGWETVATTSPSWEKSLCSYRPPPAKPGPNLRMERICGRPLGIRFHPVTGDLIVADAYFGLFLIPRLGGSNKGCSSHKKNKGGKHEGRKTEEEEGGKTEEDEEGKPEEGEGGKTGEDHGREKKGESRLKDQGSGGGESEGEHGVESEGGGGGEKQGVGEERSGEVKAKKGEGEERSGQVKGNKGEGRTCAASGRPEFGPPELLADSAEGAKFKFTNDMDIDATDSGGVIYFTDTSTKFSRRNFVAAIMEGGAHGRLLKHNLSRGTTEVLLRGLKFPNGVALSRDRSFLVFCESTLARCHKYFLRGQRAGSLELFLELPGIPDNIRLNPRGRFWIAVHVRRNKVAEFYARRKWLRTLVLRLLPNTRLIYLLGFGRPKGMVIEVDESGKVTTVLEDKEGRVVRAVSEVEEHGGKLWMGSVIMPHVAVLKWR